MRKLIALLSAAVLVTPAFAGGTVALNDAEPEAIQQTTERRWAIEVEAGLADLVEQENFESYRGDGTNRCLVDLNCTEDTRNNFYGVALFWQANENYAFGLRYQKMAEVYGMDFGTGVSLSQDSELLTLAARRVFTTSLNTQPFIEAGIGRYSSEAHYSNPASNIVRNDTHNGWTPVVGAGAIIRITENISLTPSLRYIRSMGERAGIMGLLGGLHVKTLDDPVTQLSIGLRFEL